MSTVLLFFQKFYNEYNVQNLPYDFNVTKKGENQMLKTLQKERKTIFLKVPSVFNSQIIYLIGMHSY